MNDGLNKREKFILPKTIKDSFIVSKKASECFDINYVHKKQNEKKICRIGNVKKEQIDFIVFGDSHIISFYSLLDNLAKKYGKSGLFTGYSVCPPILNVYPLRPDQKEKNCYQLNKLISQIVNENEIKNIILISRWTYYTDGNNFGANLNFLALKPRRSSNKVLSREAFTQGLADTLKNYGQQGKNVFIVEQAPNQVISPEQIYYRSFDNNLLKFKNNIIHYSLNLKQHYKHQSFVKKVLNKLDISYNNLTLINLDNIFCSKSKQKCLIGNEKYSFYIDRNHLSKDGASLTRNKFIKMIEKF